MSSDLKEVREDIATLNKNGMVLKNNSKRKTKDKINPGQKLRKETIFLVRQRRSKIGVLWVNGKKVKEENP